METTSRGPRVVRFGDFQLDLESGELWSNGNRLLLPEQLFRILDLLIRRRGTLVTREDLRHELWTDDTFVDFEHGLNAAIKRLRAALGDSAGAPRFIETLPRRGYRFIAPVAEVSASPASDEQRGETLPIPVHGLGERTESHARRVGTRARSLSWRGAVAGGIVLAAVSLMVLVGQRMNVPPSGRIVRSEQLTFTGLVVTPDRDTDLFPALGTDEGRVYFTRLIGGTRFVIGYTSLGGGEVGSIPAPLDQAVLLNVSPDGSRLLVREWRIGRSEDPLWVIPTVGGAPRRLGAIVAHDAAWSPDGKRLAFARGDDLYLAESDGSAPRKLTTTPGRAVWVRWSPDGTRLRFTAVGPRNRTRAIWQVSEEGRGMQRVSLDRHQEDMDCCGDWSPDGRFFFLRFRNGRVDLWAIRERTGLLGGIARAPVQLTTGPMYIPALVAARTPGRLLVVVGQQRGENLRFDVRTREYARYNRGGWAQWFASSRDRAWMAYFESGGTKRGLWRSRVDGSEQLRLTPPRFFGLIVAGPNGGGPADAHSSHPCSDVGMPRPRSPETHC